MSDFCLEFLDSPPPENIFQAAGPPENPNLDKEILKAVIHFRHEEEFGANPEMQQTTIPCAEVEVAATPIVCIDIE